MLRGDKKCPHGHTARKKCPDCDHEDDLIEKDEELGKLREYLRIYGGHIPNCAGRPCVCGFAKAWEDAGLP